MAKRTLLLKVLLFIICIQVYLVLMSKLESLSSIFTMFPSKTSQKPSHLLSSLCINVAKPQTIICSDRILTCRIKSICSPAKVGLVVTDLITSPVVSWRGWETPPPTPRLSCHSLLNHGRVKTSLSVVACYFVVCYALFTFGGWTGFSWTNCL